nr:methyltransferase [Prosthecomicrobium pneumaticum]
MLAATLPATMRGRVLDLGAGAGVAGMAVAARCPAARVTLVEREAELVALAAAALCRPANAGFAARVDIAAADLLVPSARAAAGLADGVADAAIVNPPFYSAGAVRASPAAARAGAHVLGPAGLDPWLRAAAALVAPGGTLAAILHVDLLADLLAGLAGRFGETILLPVHPRAGVPAHRLIVHAVKGSRGAPALLPGLVLHGPSGSGFLAGPGAILREGAGLAEIDGAWARAVRYPRSVPPLPSEETP